MKRLRIATQSSDKLREFQQMLSPLGYEVLGMHDLGAIEIIEDGDSFAANAIKKALTLLEHTGEAALADDSGLEVDCLDGAPGIHSARYSGVTGPQRDTANCNKLLRELSGRPRVQRTARFTCALAYITPTDTPQVFYGNLEGYIATKLRGQNGFGYDPIFEINAAGKTSAEISAQEKNEISHRGQALRKLVAFLSKG